MMTRSWIASLVLAAALALASQGPSEGSPPMFPKVTGQNLNGKTFNLPMDFQAPASIVYVAYVRGQQAEVDSWKPYVTDVRRRFPAIGEYEVPTLSRGNALFRGFIDGGMRSGIHDPAVRAVTITLYIDKRPFNQSLDIHSESEIAVLLLKPDGTVLWRATGAYEVGKVQSLDAALASL